MGGGRGVIVAFKTAGTSQLPVEGSQLTYDTSNFQPENYLNSQTINSSVD